MNETDAARCVTRAVRPHTAAHSAPLHLNHILDWSRFWGRVTMAAAKEGPSPGKRLWELLPEDTNHTSLELCHRTCRHCRCARGGGVGQRVTRG